MLYDEMMQQFVTQPLAAQKLMFPLELALDQNEMDSWMDSNSLLMQLGFTFKIENKVFQLESLPAFIIEKDCKSCIDGITKTLSSTQKPDKGELAHELISAIVYSASKATKLHSEQEIESFINLLFSCEDHSFCPFGKPIMQTLTIEELTTKF
jgi:DNA mismatch repair ATPase MutL